MLGYIRSAPTELRIRDHMCYKAIYCGLCRHMGKCTGQCSRVTLSFDFVFMAAFRIAVQEEDIEIKKFHCLYKPFKKRFEIKNSKALTYCAEASALLTYGKILDNLKDEKGFSRFKAWFQKVYFHHAFKKAYKSHPDLYETITTYLNSLQTYEDCKDEMPSVDYPAQIFGSLLAYVCAYGLENSSKAIAEEIGMNVGKWIYFADAIDDYEKDVQKGRFNPLLRAYGNEEANVDYDTLFCEMSNFATNAKNACDLLPTHKMQEIHKILENILSFGMFSTTQILQNKVKERKNNGEKPL